MCVVVMVSLAKCPLFLLVVVNKQKQYPSRAKCVLSTVGFVLQFHFVFFFFISILSHHHGNQRWTKKYLTVIGDRLFIAKIKEVGPCL